MDKRVLFVLGGLAMGGVETYIVRLADALVKIGCRVDVYLLSNNYNERLMSELSEKAEVSIFERASFLGASSWVNAFLPVKARTTDTEYDVVHVVDLLMLGFVFLNKDRIHFKALSIGIYHSLELSWWRGRDVYFRRKLIELYDQNIHLTLFPNESVAEFAGQLADVTTKKLKLLPLGVRLFKYSGSSPLKESKRIVSVGRLVDFKVYNQHMIRQLAAVREFGGFEYYIYGEGPEKGALKKLASDSGVSQYVHFMGQVDYDDLPQVLNGAFCFIGSGTTIIEASAAGVPSIVGIESIETPDTCGFFSEMVGYSYNEASATTNRISFSTALEWLNGLTGAAYDNVSKAHRNKAAEFDLNNTSLDFIALSNETPDFNFTFNRWKAMLSFFISIARFGPSALKNRFDNKS